MLGWWVGCKVGQLIGLLHNGWWVDGLVGREIWLVGCFIDGRVVGWL